MGLRRIQTENELKGLVESGDLVALLSDEALVIVPSLPASRRYVLPSVNAFLGQLSEEFYEEFGKPLWITSAVRPATVQSKIRHYYRGAAPVHGEAASSHEAGCTVDIQRRGLSKTQLRWLEFRLIYYELLNKIIVEEESKCLHLMVK